MVNKNQQKAVGNYLDRLFTHSKMIRFQNCLVLMLGILVSFLLFSQTLKSNSDYQTLKKTRRDCEDYKILNVPGFTERSCGFYRRELIQLRHGVSEEDLKLRKNREIIYYTLPAVCLILPLFVVFAANQYETFLSFFAIMPLNLWLSGGDEAWLIPLFVIFIPLSALVCRRLRDEFYYRLSRIV